MDTSPLKALNGSKGDYQPPLMRLEMKIQDRIKALRGIEDAYWDSRQSRLVIYYSGSLDRAKILVAGAIGEAGLQRAVDKITFIS